MNNDDWLNDWDKGHIQKLRETADIILNTVHRIEVKNGTTANVTPYVEIPKEVFEALLDVVKEADGLYEKLENRDFFDLCDYEQARARLDKALEVK